MPTISLKVDLQIASKAKTLPGFPEFQKWISLTLEHSNRSFIRAEITIRIVDDQEMTALNVSYRNKEGPTNVLSFLYDVLPDLELDLMGDIIICAPVVAAEARAKNFPLLGHWAHMVVHGTLHLLGHDHEIESQATVMENIEVEILKNLGFRNPYIPEQGANTTPL